MSSTVAIVGGSDAGVMAALRIRELSPETHVVMILRDSYPNYSICGIPFYLSGEIEDYTTLAHRKKKDIEDEGIEVHVETEAKTVDTESKVLGCVNLETGKELEIKYDKLILATGATPNIPSSIQGMELEGVFVLRWISEMFAIHDFINEKKPKSALILGGGFVGTEMADALTLRGVQVTLVEKNAHVLPRTVCEDLAPLVHENLESHGIKIFTETIVNHFEKTEEGRLHATGEGFDGEFDMILVAAGASPNGTLPEAAGCKLQRGAVIVNERMETNVPDVYCAGDGVMTFNKLLNRYVYQPLGTTSHKQGRVAGANAVGFDQTFKGCVSTQVIKIFDQVVATTGLKEQQAIDEGYDIMIAKIQTNDHKGYYPGATPIHVRVIADKNTKKLLGAEIVGHVKGQVAKGIDIFAVALYHNMDMEEFSDYDLAYTPPLSSPYDPTQMAAQQWIKQYNIWKRSVSKEQKIAVQKDEKEKKDKIPKPSTKQRRSLLKMFSSKK